MWGQRPVGTAIPSPRTTRPLVSGLVVVQPLTWSFVSFRVRGVASLSDLKPRISRLQDLRDGPATQDLRLQQPGCEGIFEPLESRGQHEGPGQGPEPRQVCERLHERGHGIGPDHQ